MTTVELFGHLNPDEVVTLTQIMAVNGHVPANVGGWRFADGYAGATPRMNGVVGEVASSTDMNGDVTCYVCVSGSDVLSLPNTHPDYKPGPGTIWVTVPQPSQIDWRYVRPEYHRRDGWRVAKKS